MRPKTKSDTINGPGGLLLEVGADSEIIWFDFFDYQAGRLDGEARHWPEHGKLLNKIRSAVPDQSMVLFSVAFFERTEAFFHGERNHGQADRIDECGAD